MKTLFISRAAASKWGRSFTNQSGKGSPNDTPKSLLLKFLSSKAALSVAIRGGLFAANWATPIVYEHFYTRSVLQKLVDGRVEESCS